MAELTPVKLTFSDDQAEAYDRVAAELLGMGVDLENGSLVPRFEGKSSVLAVVARAVAAASDKAEVVVAVGKSTTNTTSEPITAVAVVVDTTTDAESVSPIVLFSLANES